MLLTFYTRKYCGLCQEALETVQLVNAPNFFDLKIIDIDSDKRKYLKYTYDVPVIEHNNAIVFKHRVEAEKLRDFIEEKQSITR